MNGNEFRQELDIKKPKYLAKYYNLMETISNKGSVNGGDYIKFGPFFQTYMYAFMIGYHLGVCNPIKGSGETRDFAPISQWKPMEISDYVLMLVLSESDEKLGFKWSDLETMTDDQCRGAISAIVQRIEGYANAGLNYIQHKFDEEKDEFRSPMVFVNLQVNYSKDRLAKSWDPVNNPNGIYPLWTTTSTEGPEAGNESNSNYVQDGSYLRMQTLTLGYSLPKKLLKKIGFEKIRVYGQISNVFTITGYDGLDPEVRSHTSFENEYVSSDMNKGIDYGSYGMPRQFLMGVNVTF